MPVKRDLAIVILAAGQGKRMRSTLPKVLHPIAGLPMIGHVLATAGRLKPSRAVVVLAPAHAHLAEALAPAATAIQPVPRGTGDAVRAALPALKGFAGDVLVLFGDVPLIGADTLRAMLRARRAKADPAVVVLGFRPASAAAYGRLVTDAKGSLLRIVEFKDANADERAIGFCNAGAMAIDGALLPRLLAKLDSNNAQGEFYLTDLVAAARAMGRTCATVEGDAEDALGVNSRAELALVEAAFQRRARAQALADGVTLTAPETVFFSHDTRIKADVTIEPNVVFGPEVHVKSGARIRAFSHLEGAVVGGGAIVGPYARLRPGAVLAEDVHIGNFVEVKATKVGRGAKANHLAYIGDAEVGAGSNIGAGTITCNYDGFAKHKTRIGKGVFIGSDTTLVAPVSVGDGGYVGAGSVITENVPADALAVARGRQAVKPGWAKAFRAAQAAKKKQGK